MSDDQDSEDAVQLLEVLETYIKDISREFKEGLAQIKKGNDEVLSSLSMRLSAVEVQNQALHIVVERLNKQLEDVEKGIPKEVTSNLQGMPFFLQQCNQHQIVFTNKDLENFEGMDLDLAVLKQKLQHRKLHRSVVLTQALRHKRLRKKANFSGSGIPMQKIGSFKNAAKINSAEVGQLRAIFSNRGLQRNCGRTLSHGA